MDTKLGLTFPAAWDPSYGWSAKSLGYPGESTRKNMKRLTTTTAIAALTVCAFALSSFVSVFQSTYKLPDDSPLVKAKCSLCHTSKAGGKLNAYGKDLQAALRKANTKKLTPEIIRSVDALDSNKNGVKNNEEIKSGKFPGAE
jgi:hypothetical protein